MRGTRGREATQRSQGARTAPSVTDVATPGNLLLNPSFEVDSNSDGLADSWSNYAGTMTIVPTVGGGQHGTKSQRLTPALGDYCLIHQMVPAVAGLQYTMTTCFRIVVQNGGSVECKIEWYAADGTTLVDYNYDPNLTPVGYTTDVLVHTAPAGAAFAQAVITTGGGCQTDVDFISLVQG
jgi:hypothetical protein